MPKSFPPQASNVRRHRIAWFRAAAIAVVGLAAAACTPAAGATVYYVDYQSGSDGAEGASPDKAWKHAPGDPLAEGRPSTVKLQPGDTVRFRGGVSYRGRISLPAGGAPGAPITYAGNQWGDQPAIFDGGDPVTSVTACPSAEACGGANNWAKLSLVTFDQPKTKLVKLFDNTGMLFESQYPSLKDPFFSDDVQEYVEVPLAEAEAVRGGHLRSAELAKALAGGSAGAQLSIWAQGNWVARRPITSVAGNTIEFSADGLKPYTDRPGRAAVVNSIGLIDRPGLYAVIAPGNAVAWLRDGAGKLAIGSGRLGFDIKGRSDVTIRGFVFEHFVSEKYGEGIQIINSGDLSSRARIEGNTFRQSSLYTGDGAIMIGRVDGAEIVGNTFANLERGSGIRTNRRPVSNLKIVGNTFHRIGKTGIVVMGSTDVTVSQNTLTDLYGIHGNGLAVYLDNRRITVSENRITNATRPMTFHGEKKAEAENPGDHEILIDRNFFATPLASAAAIISFGETRDVTITNNVLIGPQTGLLLSPADSGLVVTNNQTSGIHTKGPQPSDWIIKDNGKVTREQVKSANLSPAR